MRRISAFQFPDTQGTKFFYVWLDAPIGYLASFKKYCASERGRANGLSPGYFHRFMRTDDPEFIAEAEMHHFLGKDIVNFHGLFWPAMLKGARLPRTDCPACERLPDRQRREDVEVARHVHPGADVSGCGVESGLSAVLLCDDARAQRRRTSISI